MACSQQVEHNQSHNDYSEPTNLISVTLKVNGMTCEGCENAISKSVLAMEGVKDVKASHVDSTTIVVYDSTAIDIRMISQKIDTVGYKVIGKIY